MPNVEFNTDALTTNTGAPIVSNEFSLRAGKRGTKRYDDHIMCIELNHIPLFDIFRLITFPSVVNACPGPVLLEDYHLLEKLGQVTPACYIRNTASFKVCYCHTNNISHTYEI